jgi:hypothetical protein
MIAAALLLILSTVLPALQAPATPEALGAAVLGAIQAKDESAIRALVDPRSIEPTEVLERGAIQRGITGMIRRTLPATTSIRVEDPVVAVKGYDTATHSVTLGSVRLQFPYAIEKVVTLSYKEERPNGLRVQQVTLGAVRHSNQWWIVMSALVR